MKLFSLLIALAISACVGDVESTKVNLQDDVPEESVPDAGTSSPGAGPDELPWDNPDITLSLMDDGNSLITTLEGCPVYWDYYRFPLIVMVPDNVPSVEAAVIDAGIERWNASVLGGGIFVVEHAPAYYIRDIGDQPGVIRLFWDEMPPQYNTFFGNVIGLAYVTLVDGVTGERGRLTHARTILSNKLDWLTLEAVTTHELGHLLGLHHDADIDFSVMNGVIDLTDSVIDDRDALWVRQMRDGTIESDCFK